MIICLIHFFCLICSPDLPNRQFQPAKLTTRNIGSDPYVQLSMGLILSHPTQSGQVWVNSRPNLTWSMDSPNTTTDPLTPFFEIKGRRSTHTIKLNTNGSKINPTSTIFFFPHTLACFKGGLLFHFLKCEHLHVNCGYSHKLV